MSIIKIIKKIIDFFSKLIISAFSGIATKISAPKDKNNTIKICGNRRSEIRDVVIDNCNVSQTVDITENSNSTIQKIHIKK